MMTRQNRDFLWCACVCANLCAHLSWCISLHNTSTCLRKDQNHKGYNQRPKIKVQYTRRKGSESKVTTKDQKSKSMASTVGKNEKTRHVTATTAHQIQGGWIRFYKDWVTESEIPEYCPCPTPGEMHAHRLTNVVGAHAVVHKDGKCYLGIFPCCKLCNNTKNEYPPAFECKLATIFDLATQTYAGHLQLESKKADGKLSKHKITEVIKFGIDKKSMVKGHEVCETTITGLTKNGKEVTQTIVDKDRFMMTLIAMMEQKLFRSKEQFRPEIVTLNHGYRPSKVVEIGRKKKEISGKRVAQPKLGRDKETKPKGGRKVVQRNGRDKCTNAKGGGILPAKVGTKKKNDVQAIKDILGKMHIKLSNEEPLKKEKVEFTFQK